MAVNRDNSPERDHPVDGGDDQPRVAKDVKDKDTTETADDDAAADPNNDAAADPNNDMADVGNAAVFEEARDRLDEWRDWEGDFTNLYVQDSKFANADSDNGWQWPNDLRRDREANKRPALTINKVGPLCALIVNDMRQNAPSISIKPTGGETSFRAAQIFEGLIRHIEYESAAQIIYDDAAESVVEGGVAYWRVITKYSDDDTFNQSIRIAPVRDHMSVALDPNIKEKDGSDALWGLIWDEVTQREFKRMYPKMPLPPAESGLDSFYGDWIRDDSVRIAEYYRINIEMDELMRFEDEQGEVLQFRKSQMTPALLKQFNRIDKETPDQIKRRPVQVRKLEWFKIAGGKVISRRALRGKYIPIVRFVGKERVIAGQLVRRGHVRLLKDAQRMYNYNTSGQTEVVALQTKSPWTGAAAAFAGNEAMWNNSNTKNFPYLPFKHTDAEGNPLPPEALPKRIDPPTSAGAFMDGMKVSAMEMEMTSGQYSPNKGEPGNERSGKAIGARQRMGDTVNGHFMGNQAIAVRYTAQIILDLAPFIYDTEQVVQILARDGTQTNITIAPELKQAMTESKEQDDVKVLFNPKVGKYQVIADVGPAYATQRQEAWEAFVQIVTQNAELTGLIGDLGFQSADFPLADKIAERLKKELKASKPYLFDDDAPTPAMQQLQAQLQQATQQVSQLLEHLADTKRKLASRDQKRDVDAYRAESDRLAKVANAIGDLIELSGGASQDANQMRGLIEKTMREMLMQEPVGTEVNREQAAEEGNLTNSPGSPQEQQEQQEQQEEQHPSVPGARKSPHDNQWYVKHPQTGQTFRVDDDGTPPNAG